jgi:3-phenylpropionate/trans-cinnamate dioxygenase ferredoxin reductase subunit
MMCAANRGGALDGGVVIVGGGLAAQRCAETLRRGEYAGRLRIVCAEPHRPYDRPPLSKELLRVDAEAAPPEFRPEEWYLERNIELLLGSGATALEPDAHRLELADGSTISYEKLVIATGARPRTLPLFDGYANVSTLRKLEDSRLLRRLLGQGSRLAVIGAGFIGQEVAAAARAAGVDVAVIELESLPLVGLLGPELGRWFAELHFAEGVELILGDVVSSISGEDRIESLTLSDGRSVACDHVLVGVGVTSDVGWLEAAGLPATGVPTDASGRSELPDVFAAGDAAAVYDPFLAQHVVSGHWEAASRQGMQVAGTLLGREPSPSPLPSFWSDQYGTRIQYLGHAQLADDMTIEGDTAKRDFVAHYTRHGELIAAVVVGRPRAVGELRQRLSYLTEAAPV